MTISMTLAETAFVSRTIKATAPPPRRNRVMTLMVVAVVSLAMVAASVLPAHADRNNDDVLKALAAIAAIALIAKAVKDNKRRDNHPAPAPTPTPAPATHRRVPAVCAIEIGSGRGSVTGYAERCLREEGFNHRLPSGCATDIRIYGRPDRFYPTQCLRDAGFRTRAH